jgi:peptide/nickel transport system substrate-binding protein
MRRTPSSRRIATLIGCVIGIAACDGGATSESTGAAGGTLIAAVQNEPRLLLPPLIEQLDERIVSDQIFEPLAWLGDDGLLDTGYRPAVAQRWDWEGDSTVIVFHLDPKARWHDGAPLRASDVKFTYDLYTDSIVGSKERSALARVDSVSVRDSVTVAFHFKQRYLEQFFDAATRMLVVPEHLLSKEPRATLKTASFARQPVGSGRFRFTKWVANASIELTADTANYRGRPSLDRVIFAVTRDPNALQTRLTTGEIDVADVTTLPVYQKVSAHPQFTSKTLPAFDYTYLLFNLRDRKAGARPHPLFSDVSLRRAIAMGLDREQLVRSQFESMASVAVGPMTRAQALADTTVSQVRYDSAGATRLLDSLGWKLPAES